MTADETSDISQRDLETMISNRRIHFHYHNHHSTAMAKFATLVALLLAVLQESSQAFTPQTFSRQRAVASVEEAYSTSNRREVLTSVFTVGAAILFHPQLANADVSDGNELPQGAAQFSRVLRLKSDLPGVKKRVLENGKDLDKKEWDNIGVFLRKAYATAGEDMQSVAAGIANPDAKKSALKDADQLRTYAKAGDVSVNKQDPAGFVAVADKMIGLVDDFMDSLSDVPDEI
jgi:hypothetical protein